MMSSAQAEIDKIVEELNLIEETVKATIQAASKLAESTKQEKIQVLDSVWETYRTLLEPHFTDEVIFKKLPFSTYPDANVQAAWNHYPSFRSYLIAKAAQRPHDSKELIKYFFDLIKARNREISCKMWKALPLLRKKIRGEEDAAGNTTTTDYFLYILISQYRFLIEGTWLDNTKLQKDILELIKQGPEDPIAPNKFPADELLERIFCKETYSVVAFAKVFSGWLMKHEEELKTTPIWGKILGYYLNTLSQTISKRRKKRKSVQSQNQFMTQPKIAPYTITLPSYTTVPSTFFNFNANTFPPSFTQHPSHGFKRKR
ncbi:MAG: hypothetical protein EPO11_10370 [Gammaproteobacteria bacterium]|nr:MAG: hypothetical protein EPO11_10370 [Gammaproteobacteria bacterium]